MSQIHLQQKLKLFIFIPAQGGRCTKIIENALQLILISLVLKQGTCLTPPVRKLHKNSWAQLVFDTRKILAFAKEGDELKDSYRVTGRSVIRLVTSDGNYDYELSLDVLVDEMPF